jgi:Family of unknown function (DUF5719)
VIRLPGGARGRLLSVAAVVAGLAAVYGAGAVSHPTTLGTRASLNSTSRAAVSSAIRACPAPGSAGATAGSVVSAAVPAAAGQGSAVVTRLSGAGNATAGAVVRTITTPNVLNLSAVSAVPVPRVKTAGTKAPRSGTASGGTNGGSSGGSTSGALTTAPGQGGVMVQATGAMAQGLEVEQADLGGLVTGECPAPGTDFWFVGPGADTTANIELYLMNTDAQSADVQVSALTDSGPLLGSSDTGIVVPPHAMVVQSLGKYLGTSRVVALHVSTSIGQVAVAVREAKSATAAGGWLPAAQQPATSLVIPGLPGTAGSRALYIVVPGNGNAQVKVTAVTAKGSYQPTGGSGIDLPGDSAVSVELPSLSGVAAAIRVSSTVPVTAAVMLPGGATGAPGAISVAAAPVSEQGLAAANPAGPAGSADLVISAPGAAATVRIVTATSKISFSGQSATTVNVAAGHTVVTPVRPPQGGKSASFAVEVTPASGSGPVYVGRVISSGGTVRSIMPLTSALTWVSLPSTQDSLTAAGARH